MAQALFKEGTLPSISLLPSQRNNTLRKKFEETLLSNQTLTSSSEKFDESNPVLKLCGGTLSKEYQEHSLKTILSNKSINPAPRDTSKCTIKKGS